MAELLCASAETATESDPAAPAAADAPVAAAAAAAAVAAEAAAVPAAEGGEGEGSGKNEKDSKVGAAGETTWKLQAKCFAKRVWPGCEGDGTMTCACTNVMAAVRRFQKTCPRVGDDLISQIERAPK